MNTLFLILGGTGGPEIILILLVVLLLFGGKKIPELMRGLGRGVSEFNNARDSLKNEFKEGMREIEEDKIKIEEKSKS